MMAKINNLVLIGNLLLAATIAFGADASDESFERAFGQVLPQPHVLSEPLFRFSSDGQRAFLNNISEVRDLKSLGTDKYWKRNSSIYRGTYFGQPNSSVSVEYWIKTADRPSRRKTADASGALISDFNNDQIMGVQSVTRFSKFGPQRNLFQLSTIDLTAGTFLHCREDHSAGVPKTNPVALACLSFDAKFCTEAPMPITVKALASQTEKSAAQQKSLFALHIAHAWKDIDSFFKNHQNNSEPKSLRPIPTEELGNVEVIEAQAACRMILTAQTAASSSKPKAEH